MERPIGQEAAEAEVVAEAAEEEENQPVPILLICLAQSHRLLERYFRSAEAMGIQQRCKNHGGVMTSPSSITPPSHILANDSCDQNNGIVSDGRECLQHGIDDAGGTITLATWHRLAQWNHGRFSSLNFNV